MRRVKNSDVVSPRASVSNLGRPSRPEVDTEGRGSVFDEENDDVVADDTRTPPSELMARAAIDAAVTESEMAFDEVATGVGRAMVKKLNWPELMGSESTTSATAEAAGVNVPVRCVANA